MKTRQVTLGSGEQFSVPQGLQRLDSGSTRGWQVRYAGTKYFADGQAGPKKSYEAAIRELISRINTLPAPVSIKRVNRQGKTSDLPVGISGPNVLSKAGTKSQVAVLTVVVPRFGSKPTFQDIHIGTPSTYNEDKYREALATAITVRDRAVLEYERAATAAKRAAAKNLKKALAGQRDA